jgi:hypothetical protein
MANTEVKSLKVDYYVIPKLEELRELGSLRSVKATMAELADFVLSEPEVLNEFMKRCRKSSVATFHVAG